MRNIVLIAHNVRSCHNVGSLLRTAEGLAVERVYLTGYTPYPRCPEDSRLPHVAEAADKKIKKTALGAEAMLTWEHNQDIRPVIKLLHQQGFEVAALEQTPQSVNLPAFAVPERLALIVGREVEGIEPEIIALADDCVAIAMLGRKESFNVSQATAMALYQFRFASINKKTYSKN